MSGAQLTMFEAPKDAPGAGRVYRFGERVSVAAALDAALSEYQAHTGRMPAVVRLNPCNLTAAEQVLRERGWSAVALRGNGGTLRCEVEAWGQEL